MDTKIPIPIPELPNDVVLRICRLAGEASLAGGGTVRDLANIRAAFRAAREATEDLYARHEASGQCPRDLLANLARLRRTCMAEYDTHPRHPFMISARVELVANACAASAQAADVIAALEAHGEAFTTLLRPNSSAGRKKRGSRGKRWCPSLVRLSNPDHLSIMSEMGYTRGSNAVFAAASRVGRPSARSDPSPGLCRVEMRASFGPMYSAWNASSFTGALPAHRDAALLEVTLLLPGETVKCSVLYPRCGDIARTCASTAPAGVHHVSRFALGSLVTAGFGALALSTPI